MMRALTQLSKLIRQFGQLEYSIAPQRLSPAALSAHIRDSKELLTDVNTTLKKANTSPLAKLAAQNTRGLAFLSKMLKISEALNNKVTPKPTNRPS